MDQNQVIDKRLGIIVALVVGAAALRLLPHPPNFAPVAAMALFAGAYCANGRLAFALPLLAMFASDAVIGFHDGLLLVYVCMSITVAIGMQLRHRLRPWPIVSATLASSVIFFVVTNFGVWLSSGLYARTLEGLLACYVAAIPFFQNTLMGDAFYTALLFGGFALIVRAVPELRLERTTHAA